MKQFNIALSSKIQVCGLIFYLGCYLTLDADLALMINFIQIPQYVYDQNLDTVLVPEQQRSPVHPSRQRHTPESCGGSLEMSRT